MASQEIKSQIIRNEEKLLQAMKNRDLIALDELIHDDLQFVIPSGEIITKAIDLESYRSGKMRVDSIIPEEREIQIKDKKAFVLVVMKLKGSFDGQHIDGRFQYNRTWAKFGEQWKVISGSSKII